jgi:hypothetical protein
LSSTTDAPSADAERSARPPAALPPALRLTPDDEIKRQRLVAMKRTATGIDQPKAVRTLNGPALAVSAPRGGTTVAWAARRSLSAGDDTAVISGEVGRIGLSMPGSDEARAQPR